MNFYFGNRDRWAENKLQRQHYPKTTGGTAQDEPVRYRLVALLQIQNSFAQYVDAIYVTFAITETDCTKHNVGGYMWSRS